MVIVCLFLGITENVMGLKRRSKSVAAVSES